MAGRKSFSVDISNEAMQMISNEISNRSAEELKKVGDDNFLLLKKIAFDFIEQAKKNQQNIREFEANMKKLKAYRKQIGYSIGEKNPEIIKAYTDFKEENNIKMASQYSFNDFLASSLKFNDEILSLIRDKQIRMSIVLEDDNGNPIIMDFSMEDILSGNTGIKISATTTKSGALVGRLQYNIKAMKQAYEKGIHSDTIMQNAESVSKLNAAWKESIRMYNEYHQYLIWYVPPKPPAKWNKAKVGGGRGDLSEAYAYFFYDGERSDVKFVGSLYKENLHIFITEGVKQVDNISGLYKADVQTLGQYDYAVKSASASLPGFAQMISLALDILKGKIKSIQELKQEATKQIKKAEDKLKKNPRLKIEEVLEKQVPNQIKTVINIS